MGRTRLAAVYTGIAGCAILSGVFSNSIVALGSTTINHVMSWTKGTATAQCLAPYLNTATSKDPDHVLVAFTYLMNDPDITTSRTIDQSLRALYSEVKDAPIQLLTVPCVLRPDGGLAPDAQATAEFHAAQLVTHAGADIVIWGEVGPFGETLDLRFFSPDTSDMRKPAFDHIALPASLSDAVGDILLMALVRAAYQPADDVPLSDAMEGVIAKLTPLLKAPPDGLSKWHYALLVFTASEARHRLGKEKRDQAMVELALDGFMFAFKSPLVDDPDVRQMIQVSLVETTRDLGGMAAGSDSLSYLDAGVGLVETFLGDGSMADAIEESTQMEFARADMFDIAANRAATPEGRLQLNALAVRSYDRAWAMSPSADMINVMRGRRGDAKFLQARLQEDDQGMLSALDEMRVAVARWSEADVMLSYDQLRLGNALSFYGMFKEDVSIIQEAVDHLNAALAARDPSKAQNAWANASYTLALAETRLFVITKDSAVMSGAVAHNDAAIAGFRKTHDFWGERAADDQSLQLKKLSALAERFPDMCLALSCLEDTE